SNTTLSNADNGTPINGYTGIAPKYIELCVHVGKNAGTDTGSNTTVDAYQASASTKAITMTYHTNSPVNGYNGCKDSFVGDFSGTTNPSIPGEQCGNTDKISITAKSKTGTDSAVGTINACGDDTGYIYNLTPSLILASGSFVTMTFNVYYCTSTTGNCITAPVSASDIMQGAYFEPSDGSDDCLAAGSQSGQTGQADSCLTFTDGAQTATASIIVPVPGTYTLFLNATIGGENVYTIASNQTSYPLAANAKSQTVTVDLMGGSGSTPVSGTGTSSSDCSGDNETSACNTQVAQCSIHLFNPLSWFICPIISSIQNIMNSVGNTITSYLTIPGSYFDTSSAAGQPIYEAWNSIRDIALSLLVIVALVMIFSQALSIGPFDAYTVKKVLPRLIIAAIMITLSWPIIGLLIGISNGIGDGVRHLIYAPFQNLPAVNFTAGDEALIGGLGIGAALGLFGILTLGIMAALALLTALVIIVLRQIVVILLAIMAPIALVLYILPGTEKAWKLWWNSFWGALIMFPLIEAFIALGSVFSKITMAAGSTGILDKIIAYIAIYLPYFLLPMTIRLSGGMMQAIGGRIAQTSSGIQGGLSKRRKVVAAQNRQDIKEGQRFSERNRVTRNLSRALSGVAAGPRGWMPNERGRAAREQNILAGQARRLRESPALQAYGKDPFVALWLAKYENADKAKQGAHQDYAEAIQKAQAAHSLRLQSGVSEVDSRRTMQQEIAESDVDLQRNLTNIGRAEQIGWTRGNRQLSFATIGQMGGKGFKNKEEVRAAAGSIAGGDFGTYGRLMGNFEHDVKGAGSTYLLSGDAKQLALSKPEQEWSNWTATDVHTQLGGSKENVDYYLDHFTRELSSTDPGRVQMALQGLAEMEDGKGMSPNGERINAALSRPEIAAQRQAALSRLSASIKAEPDNDVNTRQVFGPVMAPVLDIHGNPERDPLTNEVKLDVVHDPVTGRIREELKGVRKETAEERISRLARKQRPDFYNTQSSQASQAPQEPQP
ncbi:MAG: hypothetical protein ABSB12_03465, partial [Candidatus Saccharimonadales bacterium]